MATQNDWRNNNNGQTWDESPPFVMEARREIQVDPHRKLLGNAQLPALLVSREQEDDVAATGSLAAGSYQRPTIAFGNAQLTAVGWRHAARRELRLIRLASLDLQLPERDMA